MEKNIAKKIYILLIVAFCILSCDHQEDRMIFFNNTDKAIDVELLNLNDSIGSCVLPSRRINPDGKERFVKLFSWESDFEDLKPDTLIQVVVYDGLNKILI